MTNHPTRSRKNAILTQLKSLIRGATNEQIIELAMGRAAIAVFPVASAAVQIDAYFAQDCRDGAAEQYWGAYGPRATLPLDFLEEGFYELPGWWMEDLKFSVEAGELARHWAVINDLVDCGLAVKAAEIRRRVLASDLAAAVENALNEIRDREAGQ